MRAIPFPSPSDPVRRDNGTGPLMTVLPRDSQSVGVARREVEDFLEGHRPTATQLSDVVLVVSELVTNALRHGLGDVVLRCSVSDGAVQVAVTDSGPELPVVQPDDPLRIGGRGLRIVDRLANTWGVSPFPGGKSVWATVDATTR